MVWQKLLLLSYMDIERLDRGHYLLATRNDIRYISLEAGSL